VTATDFHAGHNQSDGDDDYRGSPGDTVNGAVLSMFHDAYAGIGKTMGIEVARQPREIAQPQAPIDHGMEIAALASSNRRPLIMTNIYDEVARLT